MIFVIVGILILGLFVGVYFLVDQSTVSEIEGEAQDINGARGAVLSYVENCLKSTTKDVVSEASLHGGLVFQNEQTSVVTDSTFLAYAFKEGKSISVKQISEGDIADGVDILLPVCVGNFDTFREQGIVVTVKKVSSSLAASRLQNAGLVPDDILSASTVIIRSGAVDVKTEFPLEVVDGDQKFELNSFSVSLPSVLFSSFESQDKIVQHYISNNKMIDMDYLTELKPFVKLFPLGDGFTAYSLLYDDSSFPSQFIFVIDDVPNYAPSLEFISSFSIEKGRLFFYQVKAKDFERDALTFSSNNSDFPLSSEGMFNFSPSRVGEFDVMVVVQDSGGLSTQQSVHFVIHEP